VPEELRYGIGDLADLGGVSRRTVRYYVQEGLLPAPFGVGRGNHYGREHLDQLLRVKAMQEAGRTLDEIRQSINGRKARRQPLRSIESAERDLVLPRSVWRRVTLAPGVELQVSGDVRLPSPGKLNELANWCLQHFVSAGVVNNPGNAPAIHFGKDKNNEEDSDV
jgi:DNA-binding transcriptional MerR regulator